LGFARSAQLRGALIELFWKRAYGNRDGDVFDAEKAELVLPMETGRRDHRVRQPLESDVVEDVVSCNVAEALSDKSL
jgi:hypothetical protein